MELVNYAPLQQVTEPNAGSQPPRGSCILTPNPYVEVCLPSAAHWGIVHGNTVAVVCFDHPVLNDVHRIS
jgi:hypothetical protein